MIEITCYLCMPYVTGVLEVIQKMCWGATTTPSFIDDVNQPVYTNFLSIAKPTYFIRCIALYVFHGDP